MKKVKQLEVVCPHCGESQSEPVGAISTNCRGCGRYFKLDRPREERASRALKTSREVFCIKCGAPNLVAEAAISTQCIRCSHYLELGDKTVRGVQTGKLYAYDNVVFAEGCSFKGMEATGRRIEVRGKVFSKLRATAEIVAFDQSQLSGELHAPVVRIERGAKVRVQTVECARLEVAGDMEISGRVEVAEIILGNGANFSGHLQNPEVKLRLESGATIALESITCSEIVVGGSVTIGGALLAERIVVLNGGRLKAGRLSAAAVQVNPGGLLHGNIELYIPAPPPVEESPRAEAA